MMMKVMVQKARTADQFYEETGFEEDQLNAAIQKLGLQYDYDFMQMVQDNMNEIKRKAQQAGIDPASLPGII